MDTLAAWLFGSGSVLWVASCYGLGVILLRMIETRWRSQRLYRYLVIGWFFAWTPLLIPAYVYTSRSFEFPPWIDVSFAVSGSVLWLASCYGVYDLVLAMAEAKWPEAKSIREIISNLFRFFMRSHHHLD